jgi:hypothetical protein
MRIDLYTRVVLTGILLCLVWLCVALTPIGTPAMAQFQPAPAAPAIQDVRIVSIRAPGFTTSLVTGQPTERVDRWDPIPTAAASAK